MSLNQSLFGGEAIVKMCAVAFTFILVTTIFILTLIVILTVVLIVILILNLALTISLSLLLVIVIPQVIISMPMSAVASITYFATEIPVNHDVSVVPVGRVEGRHHVQ